MSMQGEEPKNSSEAQIYPLSRLLLCSSDELYTGSFSSHCRRHCIDILLFASNNFYVCDRYIVLELVPKGAIAEDKLPDYFSKVCDATGEHHVYNSKHRQRWSKQHLKSGAWYLDCDADYVHVSERDLYETIEGKPAPIVEAANADVEHDGLHDNNDFQGDVAPKKGKKRGRPTKANTGKKARIREVATDVEFAAGEDAAAGDDVAPSVNGRVTRSATRPAPARPAVPRAVVDITAGSSLHDQDGGEEALDTLTQERHVIPVVAAQARRHVPASSAVTNARMPRDPLPQLIECGDMEDILGRGEISETWDPLYHRIINYIVEV